MYRFWGVRAGTPFAVCATLSCGAVGGVGFVLKSPVSSACEDTGLEGCSELTSGVLLVVEGKKRKGYKKIRRGAAENSPEKLVEFATLLEGFASLPGVSEQGGVVREIAEQIQLIAKVEVGSGGPEGGRDAASPGSVETETAMPKVILPRRFLTADTDRARLDTGIVRPAVDPTRKRCGAFASSSEASCAELAHGPLVITGLYGSHDDCAFSLSAADVMVSKPRWTIDEVPLGASFRMYIRQGEVAYVGAGEEQAHCAMVWTGFRPYDEDKVHER